jgi:hypothetical protein
MGAPSESFIGSQERADLIPARGNHSIVVESLRSTRPLEQSEISRRAGGDDRVDNPGEGKELYATDYPWHFMSLHICLDT